MSWWPAFVCFVDPCIYDFLLLTWTGYECFTFEPHLKLDTEKRLTWGGGEYSPGWFSRTGRGLQQQMLKRTEILFIRLTQTIPCSPSPGSLPMPSCSRMPAFSKSHLLYICQFWWEPGVFQRRAGSTLGHWFLSLIRIRVGFGVIGHHQVLFLFGSTVLLRSVFPGDLLAVWFSSTNQHSLLHSRH